MPDFRIIPLAECPHLIDTRAAWGFAEWGCHEENSNLQKATAYAQKTARISGLPKGWMALSGDKAAGMITLKSEEHPDHKDLSPWLGGLYVHPLFRRQGLARQLCALVAYEASETYGFETLYLQTKTPGYYEALGWAIVKRIRDLSGLDPQGDFLMQKHAGS